MPQVTRVFDHRLGLDHDAHGLVPAQISRQQPAVLLEVSGPASVLAVAAAASALAAVLALTVRYEAPPRVTGALTRVTPGQAIEAFA